MSGRSVYDVVLEEKLLTKEQLDQILEPSGLTVPHLFTPTRT